MMSLVPQLHEYDMGTRVRAFSTTRHGGVGVGIYAGFNVNHYCGDAPEAVSQNRSTLCRLLQIDERMLVYPHQTHGTELRVIDNEFLCQPTDVRCGQLEGIDGVMTNVRGVCIGVSTADCIPVLLYDEDHQAVAAIHAGWRGTVGRIVEKAVTAMQHAYGSMPQRLRAVIGPGISMKNFEVGDEVYAAFAAAGFNMLSIARRYPCKDSLSEKWHIDLWECNRQQLMGQGVEAANIQLAGICTYDRCVDFFSARRLGINSGRILTAIIME